MLCKQFEKRGVKYFSLNVIFQDEKVSLFTAHRTLKTIQIMPHWMAKHILSTQTRVEITDTNLIGPGFLSQVREEMKIILVLSNSLCGNDLE